MKFRVLWCLPLIALAGCTTKKTPLTGERVPVVSYDSTVKPDADAKDSQIYIPFSSIGQEWTQVGGNPEHVSVHSSLSESFKEVWDASVGSGAGAGRILSTPIVADGRLFALDTRGTVTALDTLNGQGLWVASITPEGESGAIIGGGLSYGEGKVFVTSPYAEVLALDAKTGEILWRYSTQSPVRAAPTYANGKLFVLTISNQLEVLDVEKGNRLWEHAGITEIAGLLGTASPAVSRQVVIVPYSSGEIFALKAENGQPLWSETLSAARRPDSLSAISHIRALPVIDENKVLVVGHNQRMAAFDLLRGEKIWERSIGGTRTPAVIGDYIYMVNSHNELICLTKDYGQVIWVEKLASDPESPTKVIWQGPIVAGDKLFLVNIKGGLAAFDPKTGKFISERKVNTSVSLPPIVAQETLYVLTDDARVIAFR